MVTRREVVTSGAIGALSTAALASPLATAAEAAQSASDADMVRALGLIDSRLQSVGRVLDAAVTQNSLAFGTVARIREQFGERVHDVVLGCTDTDVVPKPPWRARKEAYVEHARAAPADVKVVSTADKLHNARSILADHARVGDAVWSRFSTGKVDIV